MHKHRKLFAIEFIVFVGGSMIKTLKDTRYFCSEIRLVFVSLGLASPANVIFCPVSA